LPSPSLRITRPPADLPTAGHDVDAAHGVRGVGHVPSAVEFSMSDAAGGAGARAHGQQELNPHLPVLETGALPVELHP
jgi:hypothetical protein